MNALIILNPLSIKPLIVYVNQRESGQGLLENWVVVLRADTWPLVVLRADNWPLVVLSSSCDKATRAS